MAKKNEAPRAVLDDMKQRILFKKNLEFFRKNLGMSQEEFCSPDGIMISTGNYENYMNCNIAISKIRKLKDITDSINILIKGNEALRFRFPNDILQTDLYYVDFTHAYYGTEAASAAFYSEKLCGNYIVYYKSTNVSGGKHTQYGVMQLVATESKNHFTAQGLFSIKTYSEALKLYQALEDEASSSEVNIQEQNSKNYALYSGSALVTHTMLWLNMANEAETECVSMSFDLVAKILTKNPNKPFNGARGIALSQSSGQGNQTVTFPIVVTKQPLACSENELDKYLHFTYSKVDNDSLTELTKKIINLEDSLGENPDLNDMREEILKRYLKNSIVNLLSQHIYNSHYYVSSELEEFYREIIIPLRRHFDPTEE